jgi:hypothetical protein
MMRRVLSALQEVGVKFLLALVAGVVVGVFDLWIYQFSLRGFLAGLDAGVAYYLVIVFLYEPGMRQYPWFLSLFAIVAGTIGGVTWWLVCRGSRLWMAIVVASVLALAHFASGGLLAGRR